MSLSIFNNISALNAVQSPLNTSLERMSPGLKINANNDPVALIVSQEQATQSPGQAAAFASTNATASLLQTGMGALDQISSLLTQMRMLALDTANSATGATAAAANDAEIGNAIATIKTITQTTTSGGNALFSPSTGASANSATTAMAAFGSQSSQDLAAIASADASGPGGASSAIAAVDKAISDLSATEGSLGAYQTQSLQANATNLNATLKNSTAANSMTRDTNFASEFANFAQMQIQLQAGATVLSPASSLNALNSKLPTH